MISWISNRIRTVGKRISSKCEEIPDLPYDDGAKTLFLYTKGIEGNPPEELKKLLRYMEHSSAENADTQDLRELHEMVTEVKCDRKVVQIVGRYAPEYDPEKILEEVLREK